MIEAIAALAIYVLGVGPATRLLEERWPESNISAPPPELGAVVWPIVFVCIALRGVITVPYALTDRIIERRKQAALPAAKVVQR